MRILFLITSLILFIQLFLNCTLSLAQFDLSVSETNLLQETDSSSDTAFYRFYSHFNGGSDTLPFWLYASRNGLFRPGCNTNFITGFASETNLFPAQPDFDIRPGRQIASLLKYEENKILIKWIRK